MHIELLTILLIFINTELQLIKALAYMDPPPFPTIVLVFPLILINNPLSSLISIVQVVVWLNFSSQSFTFNTSYKVSGSISACNRLRPQSFMPAINCLRPQSFHVEHPSAPRPPRWRSLRHPPNLAQGVGSDLVTSRASPRRRYMSVSDRCLSAGRWGRCRFPRGMGVSTVFAFETA